MDRLLLVETGKNLGSWNMAVDELLLSKVDDPILRIYGWSRPCISVGYFQSVNEVNYKKCINQGVDIVRRITGGGAVFHDKELTYSFLTKKFPNNIIESYQQICKIIISTLKKLGFDAIFSPINDITINGRKVCGNAQTRKNNTLLQHGTILLNVDIERMFSLLNVPLEKIRDKKISDIKERVMGISKNFEDVSDALKTCVREDFQCELIPYQLDQNDLESCKKLMVQKYSNKDWLFRR